MNKITTNKKSICFLKVNRNSDYTIISLKQWISAITLLGKNYIIICDNNKLKKKINKEIQFSKNYLGIIPSYRKELIQYVEKTISTRWKKAALAQLSCFYYANLNKIENFWNIDADDTMFCIESEKLEDILYNAEYYATHNNINALSLDMWYSRTSGKHWSFGVTYIQNNVDYLQFLANEKTMQWSHKYLDIAPTVNLDWFFTYLADRNFINAKIFYVENVYFVHWGSFLLNPSGAGIFYWKDQKIHFPFYQGLVGAYNMDKLPVPPESIKLNIDINQEQSLNFLINKVTHLSRYPRELIRAHNLEELVDTLGAKYDENLIAPENTKTVWKPPIKEKRIKFLGIPIYEKIFNKTTGLKEYRLFGNKLSFINSPSKLFRKILTLIPHDCDDIYLVRQSTGESYLFANMAEEMVKNNGSKKPVFFFTRKYHFDFFEMYSNKVFDYTFEYISPINFPYFNKHKYVYKNKNFYICTDHLYLLENLLCKFSSKYKKPDFNYPENIAKYLNVKNHEHCFKYPKLKNEYRSFANRYLKKFNIDSEKFVVLYNQSGTVLSLESSFWRSLEHSLKENGIPYIYNNPKLNFKEMTAICEKSSAIIASRTGAIESLLPLEKKMFVLYSTMPRFNYDADTAICLYSLKKYPKVNADKIFEYNTQTLDTNKIINDIILNLTKDN